MTRSAKTVTKLTFALVLSVAALLIAHLVPFVPPASRAARVDASEAAAVPKSPGSYAPDGRYAVVLELDQDTLLPAMGQDGPREEIGIKAQMYADAVLEIARVPAEPAWRVLRFVEIAALDLRLGDEPAFASLDAARTAFIGPVALIHTSIDGAIESIRHDPDASVLFKNVVRNIASEWVVRRPRSDRARRWEAREQTPHGRAVTVYAREDEGTLIRRTRTDYLSLSARPETFGSTSRIDTEEQTVLRFNPDGYLESLVGSASIRAFSPKREVVVDIRARTELERLGPAPVLHRSSLSALAEHLVSDEPAKATPEQRERILEQRIDGLTGEELMKAIAEDAHTGQFRDHTRFFWRATGLLKQRDDLCHEIARKLESQVMVRDQRWLLLDLLANAGTPAAQEALITALSRAPEGTLDNHDMDFQRLVLIDAPTDETLAFIKAHYEAPGVEGPGAAAATFGAAASRLRKMGRRDAAELMVEQLEVDLEGAIEAQDFVRQTQIVHGLGNAQDPGALGALIPLGASPSQDVRHAVAAALRSHGVDGRPVLVELAEDETAAVQRRALRSLARVGFDDLALDRLHASVREGRMQEGSYDVFLSAALRDRAHLSRVGPVLASMLERDVQDPALRGRIQEILKKSDVLRAQSVGR